MVTLTESVSIPAPYEKLEAWVDNFRDEYPGDRANHELSHFQGVFQKDGELGADPG